MVRIDILLEAILSDISIQIRRTKILFVEYQNRDGLAKKLLVPGDRLVIFIVSFMYF